MAQHYLSKLFKPESIAVFGASDRTNSVGQLVFSNLLSSWNQDRLYPINPSHPQIAGVAAHASLDTVDQNVDLAVITTPASSVPPIIQQCGEHGVSNAVILSAGFREIGKDGEQLEQDVIKTARKYGIRFIGPNCLGVMRPECGLNATFYKGTAQPGKLALVSQSGALCTAILDWADANSVGFSTVVSMGISADIDFGEVLDFLIHDPETESILLYIEGIHDARRFMSGLRAAARVKPVIALKVGRHAAAGRAAMSHTGALVGSDDVFEAALQRAGVVRGRRISHLFAAAKALASPGRPEGDALAIVTNGGGPGAIASDTASDLDIPLAELSPQTIRALDSVLPPTWSRANPVDIIGDATPDRYRQAVEICLSDSKVQGLLVLLTPQAMTEPTEVAEAVIVASQNQTKPVFVCWMGQSQVDEARERFTAAGLPSFHTPETAVEAFHFLVRHRQTRQQLLQTPAPLGEWEPADVEGARLIVEGVLSEGRTVLSETESKALLRAFRIPTAPALVVRSPNEALVQAEAIGFPVAMKINSPDITHKSDVGGVKLNILNAQSVRSAYQELLREVAKRRPEARLDGVTVEPMVKRRHGRELLVGVVSDPVFGPVITFGAGGTAVEVLEDRAVALPPLNRFLVRELVSRTRVAKMLGPFRDMPAAHRGALEEVLLRVSELVCELPTVDELDINPLILDETGSVAVDARVVVKHARTTAQRYSHMAIYPYPTHLVQRWQLPDGTNLTVRPVRPEDAELEQAFVRELSERSRYFRFMQALTELSPDLLARFTQLDYDREMALIAVAREQGKEREIGVARYVINPDWRSCEFAVAVADAWQGRGVAHHLMEQIIASARSQGLRRMTGQILADNREMLELARTLGFEISRNPEDANLMEANLAL